MGIFLVTSCPKSTKSKKSHVVYYVQRISTFLYWDELSCLCAIAYYYMSAQSVHLFILSYCPLFYKI